LSAVDLCSALRPSSESAVCLSILRIPSNGGVQIVLMGGKHRDNSHIGNPGRRVCWRVISPDGGHGGNLRMAELKDGMSCEPALPIAMPTSGGNPRNLSGGRKGRSKCDRSRIDEPKTLPDADELGLHLTFLRREGPFPSILTPHKSAEFPDKVFPRESPPPPEGNLLTRLQSFSIAGLVS
jgi:hypothetical protein